VLTWRVVSCQLWRTLSGDAVGGQTELHHLLGRALAAGSIADAAHKANAKKQQTQQGTDFEGSGAGAGLDPWDLMMPMLD
jgi:hypothetical protein